MGAGDGKGAPPVSPGGALARRDGRFCSETLCDLRRRASYFRWAGTPANSTCHIVLKLPGYMGDDPGMSLCYGSDLQEMS
jgi:hypothetical protein